MKYLVILTVIVGVVFDPLTIRAEAKDTDTIVEVYNGSTNLPDWAAYKTFLINVQGHGRENGHSDHYLGRVFSIDPNSADGLTKIEAYRELFDQSGSEIERQLDSVSDRIFCSGDWRAMSFDEVVDGLEERRAFRERTYEEHLEASMSLLDDEDRSAFLAYLVEIKKRTSYTRHDNRRYYEKHPEQLSKLHISICEPVSIAKEVLEEHGGDPKSIHLCHRLGVDYVSCSPFRVPIARLAAAHAALDEV